MAYLQNASPLVRHAHFSALRAVCVSCGHGDIEESTNDILLCDGALGRTTTSTSPIAPRPQPLPPIVCAGSDCSAAWHMRCLPVPLIEVPPEDWLCPSCDPSPDAPPEQAPPDASDATDMIPYEGEATEAETVAECSFISSPPSAPSAPAADSASAARSALPAASAPPALLAPLAALPPAPCEPPAVLTPPPLAVAVVSMEGADQPGRRTTPGKAVSAVVVDIDEPEDPPLFPSFGAPAPFSSAPAFASAALASAVSGAPASAAAPAVSTSSARKQSATSSGESSTAAPTPATAAPTPATAVPDGFRPSKAAKSDVRKPGGRGGRRARAGLTRRLLPPLPLPPPQSWPQSWPQPSPPTPLACEGSPFLAALSESYRCIAIGRRFSTEEGSQRDDGLVASEGPSGPSEATAMVATAASAGSVASAPPAAPGATRSLPPLGELVHPTDHLQLPPGWQCFQHMSSAGKSYKRYQGCAAPLPPRPAPAPPARPLRATRAPDARGAWPCATLTLTLTLTLTQT